MQYSFHLLILLLVSTSLAFADPATDQIGSVTKKYIEYVTSHYYDRSWRTLARSQVFHSEYGEPIESDDMHFFKERRSTIQAKTSGHLGLNFFIGSPEIGSIEETKETVQIGQSLVKDQTFYVAKLSYKVVGFWDYTEGVGKSEVFEEPTIAEQYLIFAIDPVDKKYKIIDQYPRGGILRTINFLGLPQIFKAKSPGPNKKFLNEIRSKLR